MIARVAAEIALYTALAATLSVGSGRPSIDREASTESAPAGSPREKSGPRVIASQTEQRRVEAGPVIEGLQLVMRVHMTATIHQVVSARLELRNVGKRPRTLATYRVEMLDSAEAGLLQVGTSFATEPELKLCGMRQQATDWKHTLVQVSLRPGEYSRKNGSSRGAVCPRQELTVARAMGKCAWISRENIGCGLGWRCKIWAG